VQNLHQQVHRRTRQWRHCAAELRVLQ
jgi:hypothetical protein